MTTQDSAALYRQWFQAISSQDQTAALGLLSPSIGYNGSILAADGLYAKFASIRKAAPDLETKLDLLLSDQRENKVATRLIHTATFAEPYLGAQVTGKPTSWTEHEFVWFQNGRIAKLVTLADVEALRSGNPAVTPTPKMEQGEAPDTQDLGPFYREYIHSINTLTMKDHFDRFCCPHVTHNERHFTVDQYREMIESSFQDIQGLHFSIGETVLDFASRRLAVVINLSGTPVKDFRGIKPNGKAVTFREHVIYTLKEGRISFVWSLLDLDAIRQCLA